MNATDLDIHTLQIQIYCSQS